MALKMYWRPSTGLLIVLLFSLSVMLTSASTKNEAEPSGEPFPRSDLPPPNDSLPNGNSLLVSRKMNDPASNKQGLLAGPMFLGLASLLFPMLPMLLLAPIAVAGAGPAMNFLSDVFGTQQGTQQGSNSGANNNQQLSDLLATLQQASNNQNSNSGSVLSNAIQSLASSNSGSSSSSSSSSSSGSSSQSPMASGSSISQVIQSLGFGSDSAAAPEENSGSGSLFSGLLGNSGSGSSLLNSIFGEKNSQPSGSGLFGGSGSIFGNLGSGSRPVPAYASPNGNKVPSPSQASSSMTSGDFLGAAAAALDNAGLLGSLGGAGSGSLAQQLMNLAGLNKGNQGSSNSLSDLLGTSSSQHLAATQPDPVLGSSLSSNIVQGLPQQYLQQINGLAQAQQQSASSSPLSGLFGSSSASNSGSIQKLANNAISSISNFIFSKKRSEWIPRPYPEFGYLTDAAAVKSKNGMISYLRDVVSTLKDGVRRYEIGEAECQARLICELNQKAVGRSFKSMANTILDLVGVESYLEKSQFGARTKSVMKDLYRAARNGIHEKDCAVTYSRCPVSISVEPLRNSLLNKIVSGATSSSSSSSHNNKHSSTVYGPTTFSSSNSPSGQHNQNPSRQQHSSSLSSSSSSASPSSIVHKMSSSIQVARPSAKQHQAQMPSGHQLNSLQKKVSPSPSSSQNTNNQQKLR